MNLERIFTIKSLEKWKNNALLYPQFNILLQEQNIVDARISGKCLECLACITASALKKIGALTLLKSHFNSYTTTQSPYN